jgi:HK97 family phage portal protein
VFQPGNGQSLLFRPEDVIHFRWWAAGNGLRAPSALEALRTTLMAEDATQRMIISTFENGSRPSGLVSVDGTLNKQAHTEVREQLTQLYAGVDNTGRVALFDRAAKWQPMAHNLVDSDVFKIRQLNRDEVAAAFNMPPTSIGILDRATFSNITEQHLMEYMDTIQPVTTLVEETIQTQLIAPEPLLGGAYVEFNFNAVLQGDPVKATETMVKAVGGPFMTVNEGRGRMNLPPLGGEDLDAVRMPLNSAASGSAQGGAAAEEPEIEPQASPRVLSKRIERDEIGRITRIVEEVA